MVRGGGGRWKVEAPIKVESGWKMGGGGCSFCFFLFPFSFENLIIKQGHISNTIIKSNSLADRRC